MSKPTIGFIGLGLMGGNMVENLQKKGYQLTVMDLNKDAVAACVARGASTASTAKELAASVDIVMLCLTTSAIVEKVV
ncbi:MAG: NAD(P)-binding domain-containing protein, partial [Alishewanella sp.]|nr:NAD(P)-binding domain-containing protein [Alishewanella sp.]